MADRMTASIGIKGVTYSGWYETGRGIVTVHTSNGSKSARTFGTPPDVMAHMLLRELVTAEQSRKASDDSKRRVRTREQRGQAKDVTESDSTTPEPASGSRAD
jgi:hypothetical protein